MTFQDRVLEALGPALRRRAGSLLPALIDALTDTVSDTDDLLTPTATTVKVYDLATSPHVALLAKLTGYIPPPDATAVEQRALTLTYPTWRRGTIPPLFAALRPFLTGSRRIELLERRDSPWRAVVRVYAAQLAPGATRADLEAAVARHKPVGLVLDVDTAAGATYEHMTLYHGTTLADWATAFPTYELARTHQPEDGTVSAAPTLLHVGKYHGPTVADVSADFTTLGDILVHPTEEGTQA